MGCFVVRGGVNAHLIYATKRSGSGEKSNVKVPVIQMGVGKTVFDVFV